MTIQISGPLQSAEGAYVSLEELLYCKALARNLNLSKQRKILSSQAGLHASKFRGRGIDFSEVRAYQAGDDIRAIDWRVTARTGAVHTKLYTEERERPTLVLVDQSRSMFFGSRRCFKSVVAAQVAALLSWAALARGDRVGGIVFSDEQQSDIRPKRSHHTLLQLLHCLHDYNRALSLQGNGRHFSIVEGIQQARRIVKPGSELFIISDFADIDEHFQKHLFQLAKHNDLVCIFINDPLEEQLPPPGQYSISDGHHNLLIDTADKKLRYQYQQGFGRKQAHLRQACDALQIPLINLSTQDDPLAALRQGLGIEGRK